MSLTTTLMRGLSGQPAAVALYASIVQDMQREQDAWIAALRAAGVKADARYAEMRAALELIAAPMRPDGTWNRDREACRELALRALEGK